MSLFRKRTLLAALAVAGALSLVAADHAEARRGGSIGSRGTRTYQAPAATPTAPGTAAPVQRSTTPQAAPTAAQRPPAAAARPSMFGSGFGGALMRGLLIGGVIGLLMGQGLGGLAGMLGLLLQVGLAVLAVMLVMRLLRGARPAPAAAGAGAGPAPGTFARQGPLSGSAPVSGSSPRPAPTPAPAAGRSAIPGVGAARGPSVAPVAATASAAPARSVEIGIAPADFDAFERLLGTIQSAYSREDQGTLMEHTTTEMFGHLSDELRENAERGQRNEVSDVKLLQGDLAESWREGTRDYATVAMRYGARDVMVDRASGRVVSGDTAGPGESTEVWTFVREGQAGAWKLSAIQGA
ncbi:TIM44-like domain-containing protein [Xanthobacter dioxanivorans]|uniref:TIM44-like domain-containing protein n=1 Tax=Xanthobacter dioxanivorans TaxID=2528964 RepID=A0A974PMQ0_9HYPH|nr:TIM44-like domain-containing protein [Xanthobacter dioxanivorans]QRG06404.1 TIM44-like domain-containing protein [Xanthobacter dioxanivorans]